MTSENKSYAVQVTLIMALVMFTMIACVSFLQPVTGSVFSNTFSELGDETTPSGVARIWVDALFRGDGDALLDNFCSEQRGSITADSLESLTSAFQDNNIKADTTGLAYVFDPETQTVTVSGDVRLTVSGQTVNTPITGVLPPLPMVQENGRWFVCVDPNATSN